MLQDHGKPLADADAQGHQRVAPAGPLQLPRRGEREACAGRAERMADRDRPAVGIDAAVVRVEAELPETAEHLCGERLVDLDDVHVGQRQAGAIQGLPGRRHRSESHEARFYSGRGGRDDAREGLRARPLAGCARPDDQRRRPVVDPRGAARRDHAAVRERLECGKRPRGGVGPRMFVLGHRCRGAVLAGRNRYWSNLSTVEALRPGPCVLPLRGGGERIARRARNPEILRHFLRRLEQRMVAVLRRHPPVREACPERGIKD